MIEWEAPSQMGATSGMRFRRALEEERPLRIVGAVNAYCALLAERVGFRALYVSGAGVANASFGLPDLGITTRGDVAEDLRRITGASELPVLVDVDTGWGPALGIARTIRTMERAGAAAVHIEDQIEAKRCGHRPGKALVGTAEMVDRVKSAVDARVDPNFAIMARTDAYGVEGLDAAIERAVRYREAGADMIFAEAMCELDEYRRFADTLDVPVLANLTEFGKTPLFDAEQLGAVGIRIALYPLSAFRAMSRAALDVYQTIRRAGSQASVLDRMQTRDELYDVLGYHAYERKLDQLFAEKHLHE